jgi:glycosyltransferase involved in cell wall biosynthesis
MTVKPKISIIIASKNGGRFLRQTLDSILQQSFTDYEIVIADSVSTDDTLDILQEYKRNQCNIRWASVPDRHTDEGLYNAMQMACGEYIMLICISDWYSDRDWFKKCVQVLDNDPEISMVYGPGRAIDEEGTHIASPRENFSTCPPPSKMDFFTFWLGTFSLCLELTWCVRTDVFKKCFPKFETTGHFLQNHAVFAFNYNFNVNGYLSFFLPDFACHGRAHHDSNSVLLRDFNGRMKQQYKVAVTKYGNELFSGARKHVFRDGNSNVIKELCSDELDSCRKKVLHYRINRRFYKCKKSTSLIHYWGRKLRILALYFLSGKRVYY